MDPIEKFVKYDFVILFLSVVLAIGTFFLATKRRYKLPPGPWGLPLVGYLPFLGKDPTGKLQKLSKKYGDLFSIYLARQHVIMVTDVIKAKELLSNSSVLDRPHGGFLLMPDGVGMEEANGPEWIEQRRYTIAEMKNLGFGRSHFEDLLEIEVRDFISLLEASKGQPVDVDEDLSASISNNVLSLVTGKRLPVGDPRRNTIKKGVDAFETLYDQSGLITYYPKVFRFLAKLGLISGGQKLEDMENFNKCIRTEIDDLEQDKEGISYIQNYFVEIEKNKRLNLNNSFNAANLIGNVQAVVMAASDTSKVSLQWLLLAMASFPHIQDKVQAEVDAELGKDGTAKWIDRFKLPFTHATILEGQRWRTVVPLNLIHRVTEDIQVDGYDIPKGTNIITVITAFHNDPKYWKDPEKFLPERFLKDGKTVTEPEGYLPFSYGKRMCPGKTVGLIEIFYYFIFIMQKFRVLPASETEPPNLEGFAGLTLHTKKQCLRYVLR